MPFGLPSEDFNGGFGLPSDDEITEEVIYTAENAAHDNLVRNLVEAGAEVCQLQSDKDTLIYNLKEVVKWLDYFVTTEPDDPYIEEARTARWVAECCLMDMEEG